MDGLLGYFGMAMDRRGSAERMNIPSLERRNGPQGYLSGLCR
jgi:hypothetical protein